MAEVHGCMLIGMRQGGEGNFVRLCAINLLAVNASSVAALASNPAIVRGVCDMTVLPPAPLLLAPTVDVVPCPLPADPKVLIPRYEAPNP